VAKGTRATKQESKNKQWQKEPIEPKVLREPTESWEPEIPEEEQR